MAGELSPDRQYFWDGARWVSAVSPDGAWRWDGRAWQGSSNPSRMSGRIAALIAVGVIASLIMGGLAIAAASRLLASERTVLQTSLGSSCTGSAGLPGSQLSEGELVCGRKLGVSYLTADCTQSTSVPSVLDAEQVASPGASWTPADVGVDAGGCEMSAQPDQLLEIVSKGLESPDLVVVADFVPAKRVGSLGLRLACIQTASCVDVVLYTDTNSFSLDEGKPATDGWQNITQGPLVLARLRFGQPNRMILRYALGVAYVFLNGVEVTHGTPTFGQLSGYAGFYIDDRESSAPEQAQLKKLYMFGA